MYLYAGKYLKVGIPRETLSKQVVSDENKNVCVKFKLSNDSIICLNLVANLLCLMFWKETES